MRLSQKGLIAVLFVLFLININASAQTKDARNWATLAYNNNQYGSIIRLPVDNIVSFKAPSFTLGIERYINKSFNLSIAGSVGQIFNEFDRKSANMFGLHVVTKFKLNNGKIFKESAKIAPFIALGAGFLSFDEVRPQTEDGFAIDIAPTAGVDWNLTDKFKIFASTSYKINSKIRYREYAIGVGFALNSNKDNDGDGIVNRKDACPDVFGPEDNNGCPYPDRDGDGVIDKEDQCPDLAGNLPNGCPDTDGDGIADDEDKCPEVAGKDGQGCPLDSDGDGIIDEEDQCPNQAGSSNGCPVEPDAPQVIDTDNDGIPDTEDDCPADKGDLENKGCPVYVPELPVEIVTFRWNSTDLLPVYRKALDEIAALMNEYDFQLEINGHSDNSGDTDYNLYISKLRASVVLEYLVEKGVSRSRMTSNGFGIKQPIADNASRVGRAKNRRVEMKIVKE